MRDGDEARDEGRRGGGGMQGVGFFPARSGISTLADVTTVVATHLCQAREDLLPFDDGIGRAIRDDHKTLQRVYTAEQTPCDLSPPPPPLPPLFPSSALSLTLSLPHQHTPPTHPIDGGSGVRSCCMAV